MNTQDSNTHAAALADVRRESVRDLCDALHEAEEDYLAALVNTRGLFPGLIDSIDAFVSHREMLDEVDDPDALADEDGGKVSDELLNKAAMLVLIWGEEYPEVGEPAMAYGRAQRALLRAEFPEECEQEQ